MSSKILITGMTGFAGSHLAHYVLDNTDWEIYSLERLSSRLGQIESPRIHKLCHDFRAELPDRLLKSLEGIDYIIHNGAEVHGLKSVENPELYVHTNVMGTFNLLEAARKLKPKKFIYVSSAEAVGGAPIGKCWDENATLKPSNPYAASKAIGEMLVRAYHISFNVPALSVRMMNVFGERQDTSKFLPATIKKVLSGETVVCHVDNSGISGSRHWIYVGELIMAFFNLFIWGSPGETYHVVGPEISNLEIIRTVASVLGVKSCSVDFAQPGPSHDMRYSIQDTKLSTIAYDPSNTEYEMRKTIAWYKEHPEWLV